MTKWWRRAWTLIAPGLLIGIGTAFGAPQPRGETRCELCRDNGNDPETAVHQFAGAPGAFLECGDEYWINPCHGEELDGVCTSQHGACGASNLKPSDIRFVAELVRAEKVEQLGSFLADHPTTVVYNRARQAVQVFDCTGRVAAHLPLEEAFVLTLAANHRQRAR